MAPSTSSCCRIRPSCLGRRNLGAESRRQHGEQGKSSLPDPVVAELALLGLVHVNGAGWRLVQIRRGRGSGHLIIRFLVARGGTHGSCGESGAGQRGAAARSPHPIPPIPSPQPRTPPGARRQLPGPRRLRAGPQSAAAAPSPPLTSAAADK